MTTKRIIKTKKGQFRIDIDREAGVVYAVRIGDFNYHYTMPLKMADKSNEEIADYINNVATVRIID